MFDSDLCEVVQLRISGKQVGSGECRDNAKKKEKF